MPTEPETTNHDQSEGSESTLSSILVNLEKAYQGLQAEWGDTARPRGSRHPVRTHYSRPTPEGAKCELNRQNRACILQILRDLPAIVSYVYNPNLTIDEVASDHDVSNRHLSLALEALGLKPDDRR